MFTQRELEILRSAIRRYVEDKEYALTVEEFEEAKGLRDRIAKLCRESEI